MSKNKIQKGAGGKSSNKKVFIGVKNQYQTLKKFRYHILALTLLFLGFLIYYNTLNVPFYFDDYDSIIDNPTIKNLSYFKQYNGIYDLMHIRYFSYLSFAINFYYSGVSVVGYHITNIAIHFLSSIMVMLLIRQILDSPTVKDSLTNNDKFKIAVFGSILFLVHPIQTQAVTYIVQRMTSLATLFYLTTVFFYVWGRNLYYSSSTIKNKLVVVPLFLASAIAFFLSLFSKEIAVTLPISIVMCELLFIRNRKMKISWGVVGTITAFFLVTIIVVITNYGLPIEADNIPRLVYLFTQIDVMFTYFRLLFFPVYQNIDYDFPLRSSLVDPELIIKLMVILAILFYAIKEVKKNKIITFGIFWFFITISVESSIIPIRDVINEHRLYLPMFGFVIMMGVFLLKMSKKFSGQKTFYIMSLILTVVLSILSYERNKLWNDPGKMWSDVISKSPAKDRPYLARGSYYLRENQADAAIADFLKVISLNKKEFRAYDNIGYAYQTKDMYDQAIRYHDIAIQMNPSSAFSYNNRGVCLLYLKEWDKAILDFNKAISLQNTYTDAYFNLGYVYYLMQDYSSSIKYFSQALILNPSYNDIYPYLVMANYRLGKIDQAKEKYAIMKNKGMKISPSIKNVMGD